MLLCNDGAHDICHDPGDAFVKDACLFGFRFEDDLTVAVLDFGVACVVRVNTEGGECRVSGSHLERGDAARQTAECQCSGIHIVDVAFFHDGRDAELFQHFGGVVGADLLEDADGCNVAGDLNGFTQCDDTLELTVDVLRPDLSVNFHLLVIDLAGRCPVIPVSFGFLIVIIFFVFERSLLLRSIRTDLQCRGIDCQRFDRRSCLPWTCCTVVHQFAFDRATADHCFDSTGLVIADDHGSLRLTNFLAEPVSALVDRQISITFGKEVRIVFKELRLDDHIAFLIVALIVSRDHDRATLQAVECAVDDGVHRLEFDRDIRNTIAGGVVEIETLAFFQRDGTIFIDFEFLAAEGEDPVREHVFFLIQQDPVAFLAVDIAFIVLGIVVVFHGREVCRFFELGLDGILRLLVEGGVDAQTACVDHLAGIFFCIPALDEVVDHGVDDEVIEIGVAQMLFFRYIDLVKQVGVQCFCLLFCCDVTLFLHVLQRGIAAPFGGFAVIDGREISGLFDDILGVDRL